MSNIIKPDFQKKREPQQNKTADQEAAIPDYRLRLEIAFSSPSIWRRIVVPGRTTLEELHKIVNACYGWTDENDHRFWIGKIFYGPAKDVTRPTKFDQAGVQLHELEDSMGFIFTYLYDAGSGWECEITLEETLSNNGKSGLPRVEEGEQANPSLEFIDIHEYQSFLGEFESLSERDASRLLSDYHLAKDFDPEYCDIESLGQAVKQLI